jgi:hypothetical protein
VEGAEQRFFFLSCVGKGHFSGFIQFPKTIGGSREGGKGEKRRDFRGSKKEMEQKFSLLLPALVYLPA